MGINGSNGKVKRRLEFGESESDGLLDPYAIFGSNSDDDTISIPDTDTDSFSDF